MTITEGVVFLAAGITLFIATLSWMTLRERSSARPVRTVAGFERSRHALQQIFRAQQSTRQAALARARGAHPAGSAPVRKSRPPTRRTRRGRKPPARTTQHRRSA